MALTPNKIANEVKRIYKYNDSQIKNISRVCKKGCAFCCFQSISIVLVEEYYIKKYINDFLPEEIKNRLKKNFDNWLDYFMEVTPQISLSKPFLDEKDIFNFEHRIAVDKIPCPFLLNNECSIYEVRPIVCRTYLIDDDSQICNTTHRRDPVESVKRHCVFAIKELLRLLPKQNRHFRLLTYATRDFFVPKRQLKPVGNLVFYKDIHLMKL